MATSLRPEGRIGVPLFRSQLKSRPPQNLYFFPKFQHVSVRPTSNVGTAVSRASHWKKAHCLNTLASTTLVHRTRAEIFARSKTSVESSATGGQRRVVLTVGQRIRWRHCRQRKRASIAISPAGQASEPKPANKRSLK